MGWSGGSEIACDIWKLVGKYVPKAQKKRVARRIIDIFEQQDCDTMAECDQLMKDAGVIYDDDGYIAVNEDTGEYLFK